MSKVATHSLGLIRPSARFAALHRSSNVSLSSPHQTNLPRQGRRETIQSAFLSRSLRSISTQRSLSTLVPVDKLPIIRSPVDDEVGETRAISFQDSCKILGGDIQVSRESVQRGCASRIFPHFVYILTFSTTNSLRLFW